MRWQEMGIKLYMPKSCEREIRSHNCSHAHIIEFKPTSEGDGITKR